METIINQILHGIMLGVMYSLVAVGFTLFFGVLNLIQFYQCHLRESSSIELRIKQRSIP